jgi:divalent metal cation (Fe/Co/Zn/Cd) transporter
VHAICDELEDQIRAEFGSFDILIHPEPAGIHAPETKESQYENAKKPAEIEES